MTVTRKRILGVGIVVTFGIAFLAKSLGATQEITTCEGVGCFGGQPGCFWYHGNPGTTYFCFGVRP